MPDNLIQYDPKRHKGKQLYELVADEEDDTTVFSYRNTQDSHEDVADIPWYYAVEAD